MLIRVLPILVFHHFIEQHVDGSLILECRLLGACRQSFVFKFKPLSIPVGKHDVPLLLRPDNDRTEVVSLSFFEIAEFLILEAQVEVFIYGKAPRRVFPLSVAKALHGLKISFSFPSRFVVGLLIPFVIRDKPENQI